MTTKIQSISTVKHCGLVTADAKELKYYANPRQIREHWLESNKNGDITFRMSDVLNPEKSNQLKIGNLKLLEKAFLGATDTFYYGPLGTNLWTALKGGHDSEQAMYDLCKVIGVHPHLLYHMSDKELYILANYFPETSLFVLAYEAYKFNLFSRIRPKPHKHLINAAISLDTYFCFEDVSYLLFLYGIDSKKIKELLVDDCWYISKDKPERLYPVVDSLYVTTGSNGTMTLGSYVSSIYEDSRYTDAGDIMSTVFVKKYIEPVTYHYGQLPSFLGQNWDS